METDDQHQSELISDQINLTTQIVAAYVANNHVQPGELASLIGGVHAALGSLGQATQEVTAPSEKLTPAQIRKSITPDALISFVDGKPYKTLKRHLTTHGLDFAAYRARYGLPVDYPSTAPNYSAQRSALARTLGLGRKADPAAQADATDDEGVAEAPKRRGRSKKAAE